MFTPREIFDMAIRLEENGEAFYKNASKYAQLHGMPSHNADFWEQLALEEREHRKLFLDMKRSFFEGGKTDFLEKIESWFVVEAIGEKFFSFDPSCALQALSFEEIISLARSVEEDSIRFYEFLKNLVYKDDSLAVLERIIQEEQHHIARLDELMKNR